MHREKKILDHVKMLINVINVKDVEKKNVAATG